ncbi:MAG TPA: HAD-IC family P-type ATPase [Symbiobacteriaceae bacterium]|nr:HAD-IC family P-type ATPase [Symbiobacteriaceae bacterium]
MRLHVVHALPGRVRLHLPDLVSRPDRCRIAETAVASLAGVLVARATEATGSLLIRFDARLALRDLLRTLTSADSEAAATAERVVPLRRPAPRGLTDAEAQQRLQKHGPNIMPAPETQPFWRRFLAQFQDLSTVILLTGTLLAAAFGRPVEAFTVGAITAMSALVGAWRAGQRDHAVAALHSRTAARVVAVRGGRPVEVPAADLVPGDLVILRAGDRVPADSIVVNATDLEVEDRFLFTAYSGSPALLPTDRFLPAGSGVAKGRAEVTVVATGAATALGRLAHTLGQTEQLPSPVERRSARLARDLLKVAVVAFLVVGGAGLAFGQPLTQIIESSLSVAAAAVPEGLPTFTTLALAAGARRLARRGAYVRDLAAAEGVGAVDVICTDKTGTLTRQEMTVRTIFTGDTWWEVTGTGLDMKGEFLKNGRPVRPLEEPDLRAFLQTAVRCNNATLEEDPDGNRHVVGSYTEGALLMMAAKAGLAAGQESRLGEESFDPTARRMSATVGLAGARITCSKGAPEVILPMCNRMLRGEATLPMTAESRDRIREAVGTLARGGHRVIALAYAVGDEVGDGYIFAGLAGISDPPRRELRPAILRMSRNGIRTVMLTGDHPETATAVARELGLLLGKREVVIGADLNRLTDWQLDRIVERVGVFARVTPDQKARVIRSLQRRGRTVAYLGDGMDDAPAVRAADIGVAPQGRGTDVTREAARIILTEDRFDALVRAIEQGRNTAGNTDDIARFLLTVNMAELLTMLAAALFGWPLPLLPLQLLWLNLIGNSPAALALGERHAPPGDDLPARQRPVQSLEKDLLVHALEMGLATFGLFATTLVSGGTLVAARTMALTALGAGQILYLFRCRTALGTPCGLQWPAEPAVALAAGISGLLLLATVYFPPLAGALGTVPLSMAQWLAVLGAAVAGNLSAVATFSLERPSSPQPSVV